MKRQTCSAQSVNRLNSLPLFAEPADAPPLLLVASSETVEVLYLNGSKASAQAPLKGAAVLTLDYSYKQDTVCWVESRDLSSQLKCSRITKAGKLTEEWIENIAQHLHSEYLSVFQQSLACQTVRGAFGGVLGIGVANSVEPLNIAADAAELCCSSLLYVASSCSICTCAKLLKDECFMG